MEDVYTVSLLGALKPGIDPNAAKKALSDIFKVSPELFKTYPDGKKRIVKQGLSLIEAKKYQTVLNRVGAFSEIDVVLDRRILAESSVFCTVADSNAGHHPATEALSSATAVAAEPGAIYDKRLSNKDPAANFMQSAGFKFEISRFIPAIYSGPGCVPATDPAGTKIGAIQSHHPVLGQALTLSAAVISAFVILLLGLFFLSAEFPSFPLATPVMIFIFLVSLVFLPRIFRFKKVLRVMVSVDGKQTQICRIRERKWGWPFTREFIVEDDCNRQIARVMKNQFFLTCACTTKSGETVYSADPGVNVEDSMVYFGESIREELFIVAAWIVQAFGKVRSIVNFFKTWHRQSTGKEITIFDNSGSVAAELTIGRLSFKEPKLFSLRVGDGAPSEADRRILLAFGLLLAGL